MIGMRASSRRRFEVGHDFELARLVERGQRLVHQQQRGRGEQGAANGDALFFAAGKAVRIAAQQMLDAEQAGDAREVFAVPARPRTRRRKAGSGAR